MPILTILGVLLVLCLLWWAINAGMAAFGVGDPIATVVRILFVVFVCLWLLSLFGVGIGGPAVSLR